MLNIFWVICFVCENVSVFGVTTLTIDETLNSYWGGNKRASRKILWENYYLAILVLETIIELILEIIIVYCLLFCVLLIIFIYQSRAYFYWTITRCLSFSNWIEPILARTSPLQFSSVHSSVSIQDIVAMMKLS